MYKKVVTVYLKYEASGILFTEDKSTIINESRGGCSSFEDVRR